MEMLQEQRRVFVRLRVSGRNQPSSVNGRHPDVDHLNRRQLFQHGGGSQPRCIKHQAVFQRDLQAIGQERNQDMRIHAMLQPMVNRAKSQIAFQGTEHRFDLRQLYVARPEDGGIFAADVGARQVVAIAQFGLFELALVHAEPE